MKRAVLKRCESELRNTAEFLMASVATGALTLVLSYHMKIEAVNVLCNSEICSLALVVSLSLSADLLAGCWLLMGELVYSRESP